MKFSPTVSLALVLAAGVAGAAVAQTTMTPGTGTASLPKSSISEPKSTVAKPLAGPTGEMKAAEPKAKSAEMKATQPRAKRTAHLRATHPNRMAQMKAARTAHLQRPMTQAERLTPDQIKAAQQQLQTAGLYNGPVDGMMDPDTRAALARFQQQNGLHRTERLDRQTLARLNGNQTTGVGSSTPSGNEGAAAPTNAGGNTTGQPIGR